MPPTSRVNDSRESPAQRRSLNSAAKDAALVLVSVKLHAYVGLPPVVGRRTGTRASIISSSLTRSWHTRHSAMRQ